MPAISADLHYGLVYLLATAEVSWQKTCSMHTREAELWNKMQSQRCAAGWADFRVSLYLGGSLVSGSTAETALRNKGKGTVPFAVILVLAGKAF